ncbi:hypothetical protein HYPSUDRAFT_1000374 [Hypholoma sublateritium FD-334 SS-4]|uniref:Uncharacterized protein n=1 Tax=Hypholoma sublateritium (strain FD-334 SS-4) TaxID=945553 RepID=A0A0D2M3X4_HYPSF|nr:hypothetical protein HYPSUDRAFT_1000374 [Hypholoma sublateritium FD-334 SS-4]
MSRNWMVLLAITVLYCTNLIQTSVQWFLLKELIGTAGGTQLRTSLHADSEGGSNWSNIITNVNFLLSAGASDGLLIWRCYIVWSGSYRAILLPLLLFLVEIGACIANILEISINYSNPDKFAGTPLQVILDGVGLFTTSALTLITTALIVYRIHSVSQPNLVKYPRNSYGRIIDLLVQSAAAYSLVALIYAVSSVIPGAATFPGTEHQIPNVYLHAFTYEIFMIAAGMAPTIMVARIALDSRRALNRETVAHVSDLEFQEPNADLTVTQIPVPGDPVRGR